MPKDINSAQVRQTFFSLEVESGDKTSASSVTTRPGPNITLNLSIIQIIILNLSTLLFKRKLPIILKKKPKCK